MRSPGSAAHDGRRRQLVALVLLAALAIASASAFAQPGRVRAQLASPTVSLGESVRLAIVAEGIDGELDTSALEREFDVVGRSSSRDVQILNGTRRSTVTWVLEIIPREVGVFTVPAVTVGGVESELVTLTVTEAPTGAARDVFVEAVVDTTTPWVQSQVILTLRVFRAIDIVDGSLGEPLGEGLEIRALGEDRRGEAERDGRRYVVVERRFALFPQRSGPLVVEPVALTVTVPRDSSRGRGFFSPTRRLTRRTEPVALDVRPRPPGSSGWWLPADDVALEERWSADVTEARVGEPLTRTLQLRASGALGAQLPDVVAPSVDGLAIYVDDPARTSDVGPDGVESTLTQSLAVIPEREGRFELPAVDVGWFDVEAGRPRTATLPARTLTVLPAAGSTGSAGTALAPDPPADPAAVDEGDATDAETDGAIVPPEVSAAADGAAGEGLAPVPERWRTLALAAFAGWALTALALAFVWRGRATTRPPADAAPAGDPHAARAAVRDARERIERAARDGDVARLVPAVLERAALRWPDDPPRSLVALGRRVGAADGDESADGTGALVRTLKRLDAIRYGGGRGAPGSVDGGLDGAEAADVAELPTRLERALERAPGTPARDVGARDGRADATGLPPL